ncbi:MAG: hypothetical protein MASP_00497 [Candidatus Methanolliviera sp. GoM_asphalt]|nr:MAG: hypothetical protein MASP_00497 [Candidatus Methanolliviera sp. GoM_asphalt]
MWIYLLRLKIFLPVVIKFLSFGKIKLGFNVHKIYLGRLDESYEKELPYNDGIEIELKPKEIKTIIFEVL